jgi:hypothetical protein
MLVDAQSGASADAGSIPAASIFVVGPTTCYGTSSGGESEEAPHIGDALELMVTAILEPKA